MNDTGLTKVWRYHRICQKPLFENKKKREKREDKEYNGQHKRDKKKTLSAKQYVERYSLRKGTSLKTRGFVYLFRLGLFCSVLIIRHNFAPKNPAQIPNPPDEITQEGSKSETSNENTEHKNYQIIA